MLIGTHNSNSAELFSFKVVNIVIATKLGESTLLTLVSDVIVILKTKILPGIVLRLNLIFDYYDKRSMARFG